MPVPSPNPLSSFDATREYTTLRLVDRSRRGLLDQVEICDALRSEYERGWRHRETHLQIRLSNLPWGLRQIVTCLLGADRPID